VPWRFLDACQLSALRLSLLPASKNLHREQTGYGGSPRSLSASGGPPAWPPVNAKRVYRLMTKYGLLLERHTAIPDVGDPFTVYPARCLKKSDERTVGFIVTS